VTPQPQRAVEHPLAAYKWLPKTLGYDGSSATLLSPPPPDCADMLTALYYVLMLLVGYVWYRHGQKLLKQGLRDENDELTKPPVGPVGFLLVVGVGCYLLFEALRAIVLRQIPCVGKGCNGQIYTLAEHAGSYWANLFFVVWLVLALGYTVYVSVKIWTRG
jgi:hypothetical protein